MEELEDLKNIKKNKQKMWMLNLVGYGFIYLIVGGLLLVIAALIAIPILTGGKGSAGIIKLVIIPVAALVMVLRAIWVKIEAPDGMELHRMDVPKFYELMESIRKELRVPKIHKVIITSDTNASIVQHAHWGIFGGYKNYLMIGFPLLQTLSLEQFKAILVHEFCHISKHHGRSSLWSYRVIRTWIQLSNQFEVGGGTLGFIFKPFFKHFIPHYRKVSRAYERGHEYESDMFSAQYLGEKPTAKALVRIYTMGEGVRSYWDGLRALITEQDLPPEDVYGGHVKYMQSVFQLDNVHKIFRKVTCRKTLSMDTHPSLTDRLKALGIEVRDDKLFTKQGEELDFIDSLTQTAADELIPEKLRETWGESLKKSWDEDYKKEWYGHREEFYKGQEKVKEWEQQEQEGALTDKDRWQRAKTYEIVKKNDAAINDYRYLADHNFKKGSCFLLMAALYLERDDEQGVKLMEQGLELEPHYGCWAAQKMLTYFEKKGDIAQSEKWLNIYTEHDRISRLAEVERNDVHDSDKFIAHDLDPEHMPTILEYLKAVPEIREAYLVCKKLQYYPTQPVYLLVVKVKNKLTLDDDAYYQQYIDYLVRQTWPEDIVIFFSVGKKKFLNKAKKIKGSLIYENNNK